MAITVQSTQTGTTSASKPTSTSQNDLLIAVVSKNGSAGEVMSAPSDTTPWIKLDEQGQNSGASYVWGAVFYKLAGASEPSSYAFTSTGGSIQNTAIMRITGHNITTPIENHQGTSNGVSSKTITLAGITPATANSLIFIVACVLATNVTFSSYALTTSDPGGWAEAFDIHDSSANGIGAASAIRPQTTATGNATAVYASGDAADLRKVGFVFSIPPGVAVSPSAPLFTINLFESVPVLAKLFQISVSVLTAVQNIWTDKSKHTTTSWNNQNKST